MSGECLLVGCAWLISVTTWTTPQPRLSAGLLVNYGSSQLIEDQAWFRGYDLGPYRERCGLASISPAHLGSIAWVWTPGHAPYGPCLVVDVMARHHAYRGIYLLGEVAEVPRPLARRLGFENGAQGFVWFGACPPPAWAEPQAYRPLLQFDHGGERHPQFWPYPEQERPGHCTSQIRS